MTDHNLIPLNSQLRVGVCTRCYGWYHINDHFFNGDCVPGLHDEWAVEAAQKEIEAGHLPPDFFSLSVINPVFVISRLY